MEAFVVQTFNMPTSHPIYKLVTPMLQGTAFINNAASNYLIAPGGDVDKLLMGTLESDLNLTVTGLLSPGFNSLMLPVQLAARKVLDAPLQYPYRDDALKIWNVTSIFMNQYVNLFYANDSAVQADTVLQTWSTGLASETGGRIKGFGENNKDGVIKTKKYLAEVLTMIQFTAGAQHAALNFPQAAIMGYVPLVTLAGFKDISNAKIDSFQIPTEMLSGPNVAATQVQVGYSLGSIYYTSYGNYGKNALPSQANVALTQFQNSLLGIEAKITNREATATFPYPFLLPSKIPLSINI